MPQQNDAIYPHAAERWKERTYACRGASRSNYGDEVGKKGLLKPGHDKEESIKAHRQLDALMHELRKWRHAVPPQDTMKGRSER